MSKHSCAQILLHTGCGAKEEHTPSKTSYNHDRYDNEEGTANVVQQKVDVEVIHHTVFQHLTVIYAVDDHAIEFGHFQLEIVHYDQCDKTKEQSPTIFQVIFVYVFAKNHKNLLLSMITLFRQKATKKPPQNGRKIVFFTNYFFGKIHKTSRLTHPNPHLIDQVYKNQKRSRRALFLC